MVTVKWHGHACVEIVTSRGYSIVVDPHDGKSIGLEKPRARADLVLITHDHFDHNAYSVVAYEKTRVLKEFVGETRVDDLRIEGLLTYHDKFGGKRRGKNTVYLIEVEGQRIAHLGDLGHIPDEPVLSKLKNVDLLVIPVGGTYTIYPDEAWRIVELTTPNNVMPIHYWVEGLNLPLHPVDEFLIHVKKYQVVRLDTNSFNLEDYSKSVIVPAYRVSK